MPRSTLLPPRPPREAMRFSIQPTAMRVESRPDVHFSASPSRADGGLPRRAQGCAEGLESPSASLGGLCGESSGEVKPNVNRGCVTKPRRARRSSGQCSRLGVFVRDPFTFDDEGQLFDRSGTAFTFDDEHRLVQAGTDQYLYDGAGNRLAAWRRGAAGTRYVYDVAGNLLAEANGSNQILRYYVYGQGLLAMVTPSGASYSYHYDATGNTVAMTDGSQAVVNRYAYTPYGQIVGKVEAPGLSQPFQYVGQYGVMAEPNGFYYMRARYYDPEVGRFVSEDPIGFDGGLNLYAYVGGNPISAVDPTGLELRIYNRPVTAAPLSWIGANHAFLYSTETDQAWGTASSSGSGAQVNERAVINNGAYAVVPNPQHLPESDVMNYMDDTRTSGLYIPGLRDCHSAVDRTLSNFGLVNPGAPGGRLGTIPNPSVGSSTFTSASPSGGSLK